MLARASGNCAGGEEMAFPDRRTSNVLFTILLFAIVLALLYAARRILVVFIFAMLFAYLIDPIVRFLQRHSLFFKNLRGPHVVEAYLAFLILAIVAVHQVAPRLSRQSSTLVKELPVLLDSFSTGDIAIRIGGEYGWSDGQELRLKTFLIGHRQWIDSLAQRAGQFTSEVVATLVVVPILAIFFLADGGRIVEGFIRLAPTEERRQELSGLAGDLNIMLRQYIRAKVTLSALSLLFYSVTMFLLRFPHAIGLGILGGVLEFIPVAGWMISATAIIAAGVITHAHWIWMAALLAIWRMAMDYLISPRVLGQNLEIHPLMVIFAIMVGGEIGGIVGIYLSIPLIVVVRVIWRRHLSSNPPL